MIEALKIWAGLTGEGAFSVGVFLLAVIGAGCYCVNQICETVTYLARIRKS